MYSEKLSRRAGLSLIEVVVAVAVLSVGVLAVASTSMAVSSLDGTERESYLATTRLKSLSEEIQAYSNDARDDARGWPIAMVAALRPGGLFGDEFDVLGLAPQAGAPAVGSIEVILDERRTDADIGVALGMPRDLEADGEALSPDVSASAQVLPVVLRLRWRGETGEREMTHAFYVLGL